METTRRTFLKNAAIGAAGSIVIPTILPINVFGASVPSNRINIAVIGCGRQSVAPNIPQLLASQHAQVIGVCDLDAWRLANAVKQVNDEYAKQKGSAYKGCKGYSDYIAMYCITKTLMP